MQDATISVVLCGVGVSAFVFGAVFFSTALPLPPLIYTAVTYCHRP